MIGLLLPVLTGVCVFMGSTLLGAELMRRGLIPMEFRRGIALASLAIGALLSGAVCGGGGKRAVFVGAALLVLYLIGAGTASEGAFRSGEVLIGAAVCLLTPLAGSCIFHKRRAGYTKRNQQKRLRR